MHVGNSGVIVYALKVRVYGGWGEDTLAILTLVNTLKAYGVKVISHQEA
jgi:hypothetical protein